MEKPIELMQRQIALHYSDAVLRNKKGIEKNCWQERRHEEQECCHEEQERRREKQERRHEEQIKVLRDIISNRLPSTDNEGTTQTTSTVATPNFSAFDSSVELWSDNWSRFCTFSTAHSVFESKKPKVFLTNQTSTVILDAFQSGRSRNAG